MSPSHCPLHSPEDIQARLAAFRQPPIDPYPETTLPGAPRPAAVLVPLFQKNGDWHALFIRRARNPHDPHSGQVAFPGGSQETHDPSPIAAALREAKEELGLPPDAVRVLGVLPPHRTVTNYWVTPVVGMTPWPFPFRPSPNEVARIFAVPLAWLRQPNHHEEQTRVLDAAGHIVVHSPFFHPYQGEVIWGATARMVLTLLRALGLLEEPTEHSNTNTHPQ